MRRFVLCLLFAVLLVGVLAAPVAAAAEPPVLLASFWTWFDFTSNRQRVLQVGTVVMCFALFIMMRK